MSAQDAIKAAMSVAKDVAEGRLAPAELDAQVVAECRELFGRVEGPGDPLWDLQVDVARQVLGLDGIPVDEMAEWLAVRTQDVEPEPAASWIEDALAQYDDEDDDAQAVKFRPVEADTNW